MPLPLEVVRQAGVAVRHAVQAVGADHRHAQMAPVEVGDGRADLQVFPAPGIELDRVEGHGARVPDPISGRTIPPIDRESDLPYIPYMEYARP